LLRDVAAVGSSLVLPWLALEAVDLRYHKLFFVVAGAATLLLDRRPVSTVAKGSVAVNWKITGYKSHT